MAQEPRNESVAEYDNIDGDKSIARSVYRCLVARKGPGLGTYTAVAAIATTPE